MSARPGNPDQHCTYTEEELKLPPGRWVLDPVTRILVRTELEPWTPACGTRDGFMCHLLDGVIPCAECIEVERRVTGPYHATLRKRLMPCGTHAGWARHRKLGEPICDTCELGQRAYDNSRADLRRAADQRRYYANKEAA